MAGEQVQQAQTSVGSFANETQVTSKRANETLLASSWLHSENIPQSGFDRCGIHSTSNQSVDTQPVQCFHECHHF
jgi:hypothetical protein